MFWKRRKPARTVYTDNRPLTAEEARALTAEAVQRIDEELQPLVVDELLGIYGRIRRVIKARAAESAGFQTPKMKCSYRQSRLTSLVWGVLQANGFRTSLGLWGDDYRVDWGDELPASPPATYEEIAP